MPETPDSLLARLAALGIAATTTWHAPVFTVAEAQAVRASLPGEAAAGHTKNLFLRPKSGPFLLAVLAEDRHLSVNALGRAAGVGRVAFASAEELLAQLGVAPGSVSPFGLVNAAPGAVHAVFDRQLVEDAEWISCHPLTNRATTTLRPATLLEFLRGLGHAPQVIDLDAAAG